MKFIKITHSFIVLFACSIFVAEAQPRKKINFDDGWEFAFGHANDPVKDFNYSIANIFSKRSY